MIDIDGPCMTEELLAADERRYRRLLGSVSSGATQQHRLVQITRFSNSSPSNACDCSLLTAPSSQVVDCLLARTVRSMEVHANRKAPSHLRRRVDVLCCCSARVFGARSA